MTTVASYGGGVNSTAMLIGMYERQEPVDLILFADTGGEKPETYHYVAKMSQWSHKYLGHYITIVSKSTKRQGKYHEPGFALTLEQHCLDTKTMPSAAYGLKSCSLKFKREVMDEFVQGWTDSDNKVLRLIGYDAGEPQRAKLTEDDDYIYRYPLIEWGWGREECSEAIIRAGMCVPPKSACFFCPNATELEIFDLRDRHPELLERALAIEDAAKETMRGEIKGLAREFSWRQILEYDKNQHSFVPRIRRTMPCECYDGD